MPRRHNERMKLPNLPTFQPPNLLTFNLLTFNPQPPNLPTFNFLTFNLFSKPRKEAIGNRDRYCKWYT
jgi:hypothetical protein